MNRTMTKLLTWLINKIIKGAFTYKDMNDHLKEYFAWVYIVFMFGLYFMIPFFK